MGSNTMLEVACLPCNVAIQRQGWKTTKIQQRKPGEESPGNRDQEQDVKCAGSHSFIFFNAGLITNNPAG
jgi:hypothetical protein